MNGYELWRLREFGFSGIEVQRRQSEFWSKRNCPIRRKRKFSRSPSPEPGGSSTTSEGEPAVHLDPPKWSSIFEPPTLIGSSESLKESASLKMPRLLQEKRIDVGKINKIFASQWLNDNKIAMGTKCNSLMVLDLSAGRKPNLIRIPGLKSQNQFMDSKGGMHALHVNPSRTLLATGAENPCEVAVYRLPSFEPITIAQNAHSDWIFDLKWLDDEFLISGSRDSSLALFRIKDKKLKTARNKIPRLRKTNYVVNRSTKFDDYPSCSTNDTKMSAGHVIGCDSQGHVIGDSQSHVIGRLTGHVTDYSYLTAGAAAVDHVTSNNKKTENFSGHVTSTSDFAAYNPPTTNCVVVKKFRRLDKIRALAYNYTNKVITLVTLNKRLYMVDAATFKQVSMKWIASSMNECVCMCHDDGQEQSLAMGSRSHVLFFDARTLSQARCAHLPSRNTVGTFAHDCPSASGVRSISWHGPLVTIGTGTGELLFYDVRASKYLECDATCNPMHQISGGWLNRDDVTYRDIFMNTYCPSAIYTHCYDSGGTRLFTAGGPISELLIGNYAAVWC